MALRHIARQQLRITTILSKLYHTGTIGEDNIIRGDKTLDLPEVDLFSFFKERFEAHGDKVVLVDGITGYQMTYKQLLLKASKVSSFFDKRGYNKGDRVGIHVPNCIDYQTFIFGALGNGMTFTTSNPAYTVHETKQWLKSSNARALFTNSNLVDMARKAAENTNTDLLVSIDDTPIKDSGIVNLSDIIQNESENFQKPPIDPKNDVAALVYSSGTTGLPKGVMMTHYNLTTNILQMYDGHDESALCDSVLCVLPMYHIYAIAYINFLHMWHGSTIISLPSFEAATFLSAIQNHKVQTIPIVPPLALFMINHHEVINFDLSSMRRVTVGAAPMDQNVTAAFCKKFPGAILTQGYGLSEGLVTHFQPSDTSTHKSGSAGFILKNMDVKICCIDTGITLGPNEKGEVCLRGPQVMKGYFNNPEATANCIDEDGWLHTGDLGYYDEDANIFIIDRMKELIKYKALQVAPAELEDTLLSHPDIIDSCVIGIPDERAGELPRGYIVRVKDSSLTEEDVNIFMSEHLSPHKQLRGGVVFVDSLPKSASGKLLRRVLLQEYLDSQV